MTRLLITTIDRYKTERDHRLNGMRTPSHSIDIILMASNSSNFYVLKYNIKHALEESEHSSA